MRPYYQDAQVTLYLGDSRDIAPLLGLFDLLLTDPPYGHAERWQGGTWATNPIYREAFKWDASPVEAGDLQRLINQANDAIVWGGNYYSLPPSRCWLAWEKASKMPTLADFELAWTSFDRPAKMFRAQRNPDGRREHPTEKPIDLMRWCLLFPPDRPHTVLDPYCGGGSSLRAAKDLGINIVGIEAFEPYAEIAARRCSQEVLNFANVGAR